MRFRFKIFLSLMIIAGCVALAQADEVMNAVKEEPHAEHETKLKLSRKQALVVAEQLEVVKALYDLRNGSLANCIEVSVVKPCDSEWVTCVDNAWVVKFEVGSLCAIQHDGRLNVTVLVDGNTGEVLSQYPEVDYFKSKEFCRDTTDCIQVNTRSAGQDQNQCYNFVYAQSQFSVDTETDKNITLSPQAIEAEMKKRSEFCTCQQSICGNLPVK